MKTHTALLEPSNIYHVYNRGINGENIFKEERNYTYFLQKYAHHIEPIAETYAYCLLKNHFHIAIKTKSKNDIVDFYVKRHPHKKNIPAPSHIISQQFASLFNGYAQAINKANNRTGGLFEEPFRRIWVDNDDYFTELIYYIHNNPQKHGFVDDFRNYPHSSYHSHLQTVMTKLKRDEVLKRFGDSTAFEKFHLESQILENLDKFKIEFD